MTKLEEIRRFVAKLAFSSSLLLQVKPSLFQTLGLFLRIRIISLLPRILLLCLPFTTFPGWHLFPSLIFVSRNVMHGPYALVHGPCACVLVRWIVHSHVSLQSLVGQMVHSPRAGSARSVYRSSDSKFFIGFARFLQNKNKRAAVSHSTDIQ